MCLKFEAEERFIGMFKQKANSVLKYILFSIMQEFCFHL